MIRKELQELEHTLKVKWSLWKFAAPTACNLLLSIVIYLIGWHFSTKDSMPLARSGAAATAIAIAFALDQYRKKLQSSEGNVIQKFGNFIDDLPHADPEAKARVAGDAKRNTLYMENVIAYMQMVNLVTATLVWGFGDLLIPGLSCN